MRERDPSAEEETHCRLSSFDFDERRKEAAKKRRRRKEKQLRLMRAPTYTQTPEKLDTSKRKKKGKKNPLHTASSPHKYN